VEERDIVIVEPMNEAEALLLFRKKLLAQEDSNDVVKLSAALEYMPLAIVQAAAYIIQRVPRYSTAKYLERFRKSEDKRTSLLKYGAGHLRRDWEANNSIIITWQISFEHIQQIRPAAANLLSLMSFFDPQGIPENLLRDRTGQGDTKERYEEFSNDDADSYGDDVSQSSASDEESEFEDDVLVLRNFCFISVDNAGTSFEMHALVQLATRNWLEAHNKFEKWNQQFIKILCAEFPEADYENWAMCQTLLAHAKLASKRQPKSRLSLVEWATLLHRAAWYSWMKGNAADAEELAMKSMETRQNILDPEHMDTLLAMGLVELAYKLGGQWHKAADSGRKNLEQSRKVLGEEHPITLAIIGNLATTYRYQGKWKDAEELEVKLVEMSKRVLGEKDSNTLAAIGNLASTYWHQGRCKEAEELNVKVMKTFSEMLGEEHPDTLTSMGNLASTYSDQGRCKEAEALFLQVIETSKRVLGDEHPSTLTFMASLASTYSDQGRCKEAENLLVEVIEKRKRLLGEQHPDTLTSIYHLAVVLNSQGRNAEAISLMDTSLERGKQVFGSLHPMILLCYEALDKWRGTNT
jgi:tetratricopeptide (TPR) repeat protein